MEIKVLIFYVGRLGHLSGRIKIELETLDYQTEFIYLASEGKGGRNNELGFYFQWERDE